MAAQGTTPDGMPPLVGGPGKYDAGLVYSADRAAAFAGKAASQSDIAETCTVAGWVHDNAQAVCIVMAESSGIADAVSANPDGNQNIGWFQIDTVNVSHPEHLKDPVYCTNVARRMWSADGGTFSKRWATAGKCAGKTGNVQPSSEATPANRAPTPASIGNDIAGAIGGVLNGIPWFRVGKGTLGFALVIIGAGTLVAIVANKAPAPIKAAAL